MTITTTKCGVWILDEAYKKVASGYWVYNPSNDPTTLWSWGYNNRGQLGNITRTPSASPVQIPGSWTASSSGCEISFGRKTDGTLWSWGLNLYGGLGNYAGLGTPFTQVSSPVQIPGTTWNDVAGAFGFGSGRKTDGTLWSWGLNQFGMLGTNDRTYRSSPVQIPGTSWNNVSARELFVIASKTDGTMWGWGNNYGGQLGNNTRTYRSSPVQIPGTTWCFVASGFRTGFALKTDGTLWAWGVNGGGQLGNNTRANASSPVQIPGTSWNDIESGALATASTSAVLARKTDGTLWAWGCNFCGALGDNTTTYRSSPVQIPGTSWNDIASGSASFARKTDCSLWAWGANQQGELGLDLSVITGNRSSPVQIPGTSWGCVSSNFCQASARKF